MRAFLLGVILLVPAFAQAEFVGPFAPIIPEACRCESADVAASELGVQGAPDYGCVLEVTQGVMRFAINIGITLAILALMYAGFLWMTSASNPGNHGKAKQLLLNVFVGIAIMLTSWLIVDFVMKTFYKEEDTRFGPWNSILADRTGGACLRVNTDPQPITTGNLRVREGEAGTGSGSGSASLSGPKVPIEGWRSGVQPVQLTHASAPLTRLLACMRTRVPADSPVTITSISSQAVAGGRDWNFCRRERGSACGHTSYSCHYGGRNCGNESYAVDIGHGSGRDARTLKAIDDLSNAGRACGGTVINRHSDPGDHGSHVHVSVGNAECGCDQNVRR